ncbi:MAG: hypothetical protein ACE5KI_02705, partial [Dehalococcoidia bacterium]
DRGISSILRPAVQIFDCSAGFDIGQLSQENVLFDFTGLDTTTRLFTLHYLIDSLIAYRKANPGHHERLLIEIDEASDYLNVSKKRDDLHLPFLEVLAQRARHFNIVLLLAQQTCFDVPTTMLTVINSKVVFRLEDPLSRRTLAATLGLNPAQTQELGELPDRVAVVKIPSFAKAFLLQVPEIEVEELEQQEIDRILNLARAATRRLNWEPRQGNLGQKRQKEGGGKEDRGPVFRLRGRYFDCFALQCERADMRWGLIMEALGIPKATAKRMKEWFEARDLIAFAKVNLGGRSGQAYHGVVTARGHEVARYNGIKCVELPGRGSALHRLLMLAVKAMAEKEFPGCIVEIESEELGVRVDVMVTKLMGDDSVLPQRIAYEVCISSLQPELLRRLLEEGISEVVIVGETAEAVTVFRARLNEELNSKEMERVKFIVGEEVWKYMPLPS